MAAHPADTNSPHALNGLVTAWDKRLRQQQMVRWLAAALLPALLLGVSLALIARTRPLLSKEHILAITFGALLASLALLVGGIWFFPRQKTAIAREFDLRFALREKVSTALELLEGRIHTNEELSRLQLADAHTSAGQVPYRDLLPFRVRWREWGSVAAALLAFVVLLLLPDSQAQNRAVATQTAVIEEAVGELQAITENIAANTLLTDEERRELLETLQANTETLKEDNLSPEEAFATLSEVENRLQEQSDALQQQLQAQQAALQDAADTLSDYGREGQPNAEQSAVTQFVESTQQLGQQLGEMTPEQLDQAADALDQAAKLLQESDPRTAQALREAAEAIRQRDLEAAQQFLTQAAQQMQQSQSQREQTEQTRQQLDQAAQQMQQRANQIAQQNQRAQDQQNQPDDFGMDGPQQDGQQQDGQQGQQSQSGPQSQQDGSLSESARPGEGEGQDSQTEGGASDPDTSGALSGDSAARPDTDTSGLNSDSGSDQNNAPDGFGQGQFESVFAPQRIGGASDQQLSLETGQDNVPLTQGDFNQNPAGSATVPYSQVFNTYRDAVNQALDSDYIPLGLRDVVHDYFTSLDPSASRR